MVEQTEDSKPAVIKAEDEKMPAPPSAFQGEVFNTKQVLLEDKSAEEKVLQQVFEWAMAECNNEKERLKKQGVNAIDLPVVDMSVLVQGAKKQLNRIVFDS